MKKKTFQKKCRALFVDCYARHGIKLSEKEIQFRKFDIDHSVVGANYATVYEAIKVAFEQ